MIAHCTKKLWFTLSGCIPKPAECRWADRKPFARCWRRLWNRSDKRLSTSKGLIRMNLSQAGKACFCPRPSVVVDSVHSCDWCVQSSLGDFRNRFYALCSAVRELRFKFLAHTLGARLKLYEEVGTQMPEAIRADPESDRDAMKALKRNFSTERRMSVE